MATAKFGWNNKNMACVATYAILEGDDQLNQFDSYFVRFADAGDVKLTSLPYYPKYGAHELDIHGRADQMARRFFKYVVQLYTDRKENKMDAVEEVIWKMRELFKTDGKTLEDLAEVTDAFFKFKGE